MASKVRRGAPLTVRKGCYFAKGYSRRYWPDDDHARHSTRQALKHGIKREVKRAYGLEL